MRGGSLEAAREVFAGFDGSLGSGLTGEVEVEWWPFASLASVLAVVVSLSAATGRFEGVDAEDERDDFMRAGCREGEIDGLAESSCLMAATRVELSSSASSPSTDPSVLTSIVSDSFTDRCREESLLTRPILTVILMIAESKEGDLTLRWAQG